MEQTFGEYQQIREGSDSKMTDEADGPTDQDQSQPKIEKIGRSTYVKTVKETVNEETEDAEENTGSDEEVKMQAPVVPKVPIKIAEKTKSNELKSDVKIDNLTVKKLDSDATPNKSVS